MVANQNPIYTLSPDIQWGATLLATANTAKDGTGTQLTVFTADATNGGYVSKITFRPTGTATASVGRIFINNGLTNATPANNILYAEVALPAITLSEIAAQPEYSMQLGFALPAGYKLNCTVGTTVAAGYAVSVLGGKY